MRVLLVEDDRMIAQGLQTALRQDGYAVDWVADGRAAEAALHTARFDLVLLDLGLPERDGLGAARTAPPRRCDAGDHPDRARRYPGPRRRARCRRRRLHRQAVRSRRSGGAHALGASARHRARRPHPPRRRYQPQSRHPAVERAGVPVQLSAHEYAVLEALLHGRVPFFRARSSKTGYTAGTRRSRATRSKSTSTACAGSSAAIRSVHVRGVGYFVAQRMRSIRTRLLVAAFGSGGAVRLAGALTYRRMLAETSTQFDYQLRQMALSLRDQGSMAPRRRPPQQRAMPTSWCRSGHPDGTRIYVSRPGLPPINRAVLGFDELDVRGDTWRVYGTADRRPRDTDRATGARCASGWRGKRRCAASSRCCCHRRCWAALPDGPSAAGWRRCVGWRPT